MPPVTRRQSNGQNLARRFSQLESEDSTTENDRTKRRRLHQMARHYGYETDEETNWPLIDSPASTEQGPSQTTNPDVIDLTDDPSPLATHTEREVQAARTLESLKRKGEAQRDRLRVGAASSSNLGSRDRPILLDEADDLEVGLSRKATVQQEIVRQQELAALEASKREGEKRITFNTMNCVICMDVPTDLTMAACGHVFCHVCIQEALKHSENQQRDHSTVRKAKCPVCRKTMNRNNQQTLIPLLIMKGKRKNKSRIPDFV